MIKNIIFDMGGVLLVWDPKKFVSTLPVSAEDRSLICAKVFDSFRWCLLDYGYYTSEDQFLEDVKKELPEHLHSVTEHLVKTWDEEIFLQIEGMSELVRKLKSDGYNIYLLSNAGPRHKGYWDKFDFHDCFDGIVVSNYVKLYKPGTEIFRHILQKYNLKAEESVFIDDRADNCAGAFMVGIHPIQFFNAVRLREDLQSLGVSC